MLMHLVLCVVVGGGPGSVSPSLLCLCLSVLWRSRIGLFERKQIGEIEIATGSRVEGMQKALSAEQNMLFYNNLYQVMMCVFSTDWLQWEKHPLCSCLLAHVFAPLFAFSLLFSHFPDIQMDISFEQKKPTTKISMKLRPSEFFLITIAHRTSFFQL